MSQRRGYDVTA